MSSSRRMMNWRPQKRLVRLLKGLDNMPEMGVQKFSISLFGEGWQVDLVSIADSCLNKFLFWKETYLCSD